MMFSISSLASKLVLSLLIALMIPTIYLMCIWKTLLLEWTMVSIGGTQILMTIIADPTGMIFSCTVLFISTNVLMFSTVYMKDDKFINRFTILVLLFIMSMNFLIYIPHFMILLLGWDGLGIVSFILVIYYQNPKSLAAGMITAMTNRVGDVMLLLSIAWTINQGHWYIMNMWESNMSLMQICAITIAAMTKSAQMPFSSWLPAAMAAPTPVSALVHSSTLVTAGVFLLIRFYPFLHTTQYFNTALLVIAVSTMLMAGLSATTECDMKKIIALSTLSQLGMMMTSLGLNMPYLAYFHMITHALFKALLFVCAGGFINSHLHTQDLRWMGNLTNQMPIASSCITIANLALCGFPFMAGFYSKDAIVESAINNTNNLFMLSLIMFSIGLTSFYSVRFTMSTMWSPNSGPALLSVNEELNIIKPMIALSSMSIIAGSTMSWLSPMSSSMFLVPLWLKLMPLLMISSGLLMAWMMSKMLSTSMLMFMPLTHYASCMMWYLVPLSSQFMLKTPFNLAHHFMKSIDHGWLEIYSGQGINKKVIQMSNSYFKTSSGTPTSYIMISASSSIMVLLTMLLFMS